MININQIWLTTTNSEFCLLQCDSAKKKISAASVQLWHTSCSLNKYGETETRKDENIGLSTLSWMLHRYAI